MPLTCGLIAVVEGDDIVLTDAMVVIGLGDPMT